MTATALSSKSLPANAPEQTFCSIPIVHLHKHAAQFVKH